MVRKKVRQLCMPYMQQAGWKNAVTYSTNLKIKKLSAQGCIISLFIPYKKKPTVVMYNRNIFLHQIKYLNFVVNTFSLSNVGFMKIKIKSL